AAGLNQAIQVGHSSIHGDEGVEIHEAAALHLHLADHRSHAVDPETPALGGPGTLVEIGHLSIAEEESVRAVQSAREISRTGNLSGIIYCIGLAPRAAKRAQAGHGAVLPKKGEEVTLRIVGKANNLG